MCVIGFDMHTVFDAELIECAGFCCSVMFSNTHTGNTLLSCDSSAVPLKLGNVHVYFTRHIGSVAAECSRQCNYGFCPKVQYDVDAWLSGDANLIGVSRVARD